MKMRAILLTATVSLFFGGCASTPPIPTPADRYSYPLERAVENRNLEEGWNLVCQTETGETIHAHVQGGVINAWEVREADGLLVPSEIRPASPYNDTMLRLWWQPTVGSSRFVEAPAWVLKP